MAYRLSYELLTSGSILLLSPTLSYSSVSETKEELSWSLSNKRSSWLKSNLDYELSYFTSSEGRTLTLDTLVFVCEPCLTDMCWDLSSAFNVCSDSSKSASSSISLLNFYFLSVIEGLSFSSALYTPELTLSLLGHFFAGWTFIYSFFVLSFSFFATGLALSSADSYLSVFLTDFLLTAVALVFVGDAEALSRLFYRY